MYVQKSVNVNRNAGIISSEVTVRGLAWSGIVQYRTRIGPRPIAAAHRARIGPQKSACRK